MTDNVITKKRVTMTSVQYAGTDENGQDVTHKFQMVDYVREDFLDAYVAAAQQAWQSVVVADGYDAGPAGYDGPTHVPAALDHPLAGQTFPATPGSAIEAELAPAPEAAPVVPTELAPVAAPEGV